MRARTRNRLVRGSVLGALAVVVVLAWQHRGTIPVQEGGRAPEFRAPALRGDTLALASLRGSVVLVNLWATWCEPCRWEMPELERLYRRLGPRGLVVVAVSEDEAPPGGVAGLRRDLAGFTSARGISFPVLLDPEGRLGRLFGVSGLPTTFLIDRDGRVVRRVLGPARWDAPPYSSQIERLLEG
jgi:thiol-disulfide isomerase/thioredoxin